MEKSNLKNMEGWDGIAYNDGELAFFDNMRDMPTFAFPIQLEMCVIVLVTNGRATVKINGTTYEAKKDDLFICPPNNIVDSGMMSIGLSRALHMHIMFLYTARYSAGSKFVGHKSSFREQSRMHIAAGRSKDFMPIL